MQISLDTLRNTKGIGAKTLERIIEQHEIDNNIKSYQSKYVSSEEYKINEYTTLWQGDCLKLMEHIPDKSVDMILCDLPYGTTACGWDTIIPFEPLWSHYKRIIKDNGAIVLFGSEPFSTKLRMSNLEWYKYDWVWVKERGTGFARSHRMPLRKHEMISVFYNDPPCYKYKGEKLETPCKHALPISKSKSDYVASNNGTHGQRVYKLYTHKTKDSLLHFSRDTKSRKHPTQKPVKLLEYLIKTYTDENMLVLDNCMGSGSTGVACKNLNRKFIGIELDEEYFNIAKGRING